MSDASRLLFALLEYVINLKVYLTKVLITTTTTTARESHYEKFGTAGPQSALSPRSNSPRCNANDVMKGEAKAVAPVFPEHA
jgi:hypothetical protein